MQDWLRRLWDLEPVRSPLLVLYYLALIYALIRLYAGPQAPPAVPFVYQGF